MQQAENLLLVEDDAVFANVITRALSNRGFDVRYADSTASAKSLMHNTHFQFAILDLNLGRETSLELIRPLTENNEGIRVLILTGYASIATAVEAIKLGATNYLAKPADIDEILAALMESNRDTETLEASQEPMSVRRLEWEHIQKVLNENNGNISATARQLKMHRRTLQRKLQKRPVAK